MQKEKSQSDWKRKLTQQEKSNCTSIRKKIKAKESQKGLTTNEIQILLRGISDFIGCYAENQITNLSITTFPAFLVVNLDSSNLPGSHWLALRVDRREVEIFDPAGFDIFKWPRIPCHLLNFIHRLTLTRTLSVYSQKQNSSSHLCGFYCMFYIICRQHYPLSFIESLFSRRLRKNDRKLEKLFK